MTAAKTVIRDQSTTSDPGWKAAIREWAEEQVAGAPPLTDEAVRLVRGAFGGPPAFPSTWVAADDHAGPMHEGG